MNAFFSAKPTPADDDDDDENGLCVHRWELTITSSSHLEGGQFEIVARKIKFAIAKQHTRRGRAHIDEVERWAVGGKVCCGEDEASLPA